VRQDAGERKKGEDLKSAGGSGGGKGERGARGQGKLSCVGRGVREEGHLGGSGSVRKLTSRMLTCFNFINAFRTQYCKMCNTKLSGGACGLR